MNRKQSQPDFSRPTADSRPTAENEMIQGAAFCSQGLPLRTKWFKVQHSVLKAYHWLKAYRWERNDSRYSILFSRPTTDSRPTAENEMILGAAFCSQGLLLIMKWFKVQHSVLKAYRWERNDSRCSILFSRPTAENETIQGAAFCSQGLPLRTKWFKVQHSVLKAYRWERNDSRCSILFSRPTAENETIQGAAFCSQGLPLRTKWFKVQHSVLKAYHWLKAYRWERNDSRCSILFSRPTAENETIQGAAFCSQGLLLRTKRFKVQHSVLKAYRWERNDSRCSILFSRPTAENEMIQGAAFCSQGLLLRTKRFKVQHSVLKAYR